jgi:hypothetical protein
LSGYGLWRIYAFTINIHRRLNRVECPLYNLARLRFDRFQLWPGLRERVFALFRCLETCLCGLAVRRHLRLFTDYWKGCNWFLAYKRLPSEMHQRFKPQPLLRLFVQFKGDISCLELSNQFLQVSRVFVPQFWQSHFRSAV